MSTPIEVEVEPPHCGSSSKSPFVVVGQTLLKDSMRINNNNGFANRLGQIYPAYSVAD